MASSPFRRSRKIGPKQPFSSIGTPIATMIASTWFHANEGAVQRFSGPAAPPLPRFYPLPQAAEADSGLRPKQLLQLATFEHLHHDVGASDELALHVELRNGRPIGIFLDALADVRVLEDVDGFIFRAKAVENGDRAAREAALREERGALHEQHDVVLLDEIGDAGG